MAAGEARNDLPEDDKLVDQLVVICQPSADEERFRWAHKQ
jgi:hypothetical protein